jgi:hypothetical protein
MTNNDSDHIRRFTADMQCNDAVGAVKKRASQLIEGQEPPYQFDTPEVRERLGIRSITYPANLPIDGRVYFANGSYAIEINGSRPAGRRRFTLAHEIAHIFFMSGLKEASYRTDHSVGASSDNDEEERLCDIAAAEMLMPEQRYRDAVNALGPSCKTIRLLAQRYDVSLSAAARRFCEVGRWKCHVGFWLTRKAATPVFDFGFHSSSLPLRIDRGFSAPPNSAINLSTSDPGLSRRRCDIGLVSSFTARLDAVFVDALHLPNLHTVLSVAVLEKYPQYLVARFDRIKAEEDMIDRGKRLSEVSLPFGTLSIR